MKLFWARKATQNMLIYKTKKYQKSLKKVLRSGKINILEIDKIVDLLAQNELIPLKYQDHNLTGEFEGCRECHIRPDILLLYRIERGEIVLILIDIGSHSELFG